MLPIGTIYFCESYHAGSVRPVKFATATRTTKLKPLAAASLVTALAALLPVGCATHPPAPAPAPAAKPARTAITPAQALEELRAGNDRFAAGKPRRRDWPAERQATAAGQHPFAVVLSCIDSRASAEIIFDQGLGDIFSARVAGNVLDPDILGSLEFACQVAGAKLIAVVGHSQCGAVKGACSGVQLGHLTGLLEQIRPAVTAARAELPEAAATDPRLVERVAELNVRGVLRQIREQSPGLRDLIDRGQVQLVGGTYELASGKVHFLNR
jgi:carbonic anhydrase